jgi:putative copper export protein
MADDQRPPAGTRSDAGATDRGADRAEIVGRVLAGGLGEREAAALLGVAHSVVVRWKAQALEALEADPGPDRPLPPAGRDVPDTPEELLLRRPEARPAPVPIRVIVVALVALVGLTLAFALVRPTGLGGFEVFDTVNRWALYASTLFACGGVLFLWRIHDGRGSHAERHALAWWTQVAAVVAVATSMVALLVHAAAVAGVGPAGMIDHHEVGRAADGAFGVSTVLRLLGLIYIVYALRRFSSLSSMMVALTGVIVALGSFLLIGHTATGQPRAVVVTADLVHTLAASGWLGGLILLALTLRYRRATGDTPGAADIVGRFSTFAAISVAALLVSGAAMAMTEVSTWSGLLTHEYGVTILVKAGVVAAVLAAAGYNNRRLLPEVRRREPAAWDRLRSTLNLEVGGLAVVLLVTALLVNLPSPG